MGEKYEKLFLENQVCFPIYATSRLITKLYTPLLKRLDITYPQYLVLLVLWREGQLSVSAISKQLYLESNTLTPLLKRMEQKGILIRTRSEQDERVVLISLTEKGTLLKEQAVCIPDEIIAGLEGEVADREELQLFRNILMKIMERTG